MLSVLAPPNAFSFSPQCLLPYTIPFTSTPILAQPPKRNESMLWQNYKEKETLVTLGLWGKEINILRHRDKLRASDEIWSKIMKSLGGKKMQKKSA